MLEKLKNICKRIFDMIKNKKQVPKLDTINYETIVQLMKEKGIYQEFENDLNHFDEIEQLMQNGTHLHGINHVVRVLFHAYAIMTLENVKEEDKKLIIEAVKLHDIGRMQDGEDLEHGNQSAIKARDILANKGLSKEEIEEICFIIKEHSLPKNKNEEDIKNLPEDLQKKYQYHLDIVKDADKLDRVRIGDLDFNRLAIDSSKRLIGVAKTVFENNIYYYKKKIKLYQYDENDAKKILEEIHNQNLEYDITLQDIKKNYSKLKAIEEQDKIELFKARRETIPINHFIDIVNTITKEEIEYIQNKFLVGKKIILNAIYDMGIEKFMQLKADGKLNKFMQIENYMKLFINMTDQEKELLLTFRKVDYDESVIDEFYLYWTVIKHSTPEELNMLLLMKNDECQYFNHKISAKDSGYKWVENTLFVPLGYKMAFITNKKIDKQLLLSTREKLKVPLNMIVTAVLELELLQEGETIEEKDFETIVSNYHKFNLNINKEKDIEQVKKLLLSLPEDLSHDYEPIIQECVVGKLKKFRLENFEQIQHYQEICDEKILQEFQSNDDVKKLRKLILEVKIKDLEGIKRDIYFYQKYTGQEVQNNEIMDLWNRFLETQDKQELLATYQKLNENKEDFNLDSAFCTIRQELSQIAKQDVVFKMQKMQEKLKEAETKNVNGQEVIDITGTNFNLLISVIGSMGSPYLTDYYNHTLNRLTKWKDSKILFPILKKETDLHIKLGIKRLTNKRYKIDPLKNRQRCVSSIDQDFIGHIKSEKYTNDKKQTEEKLILAYFPQKEQDIFYMGNQDLMSIYDKKRSDPTRRRVPHRDNLSAICNLKLQDLNANTIGDDNEIIINAYPGAVMCFDKVSNIARKTAKKLHLPIIYIDTQKQLEIMKKRLEDYYIQIRQQMLQNDQMSDETFCQAFHMWEQDNNMIHRAFKIANSFTFLDDDEYPKEQIIEVFHHMTNLVEESLKRSNPTQQEQIKEIMFQEANSNNLRYGRYNQFINFKNLRDLVSMKNQETESSIIKDK